MAFTHILKTDPEVFEASLRGDKPFEVRVNDREFRVGDHLRLRELIQKDPITGGTRYSGRELHREITYVLCGEYGLPSDVAVLGVREVHPQGVFTSEEKECLVLARSLWNEFSKLPDHYPSDLGEMQRDIHDIQNRIMGRVAARLSRRESGE